MMEDDGKPVIHDSLGQDLDPDTGDFVSEGSVCVEVYEIEHWLDLSAADLSQVKILKAYHPDRLRIGLSDLFEWICEPGELVGVHLPVLKWRSTCAVLVAIDGETAEQMLERTVGWILSASGR